MIALRECSFFSDLARILVPMLRESKMNCHQQRHGNCRIKTELRWASFRKLCRQLPSEETGRTSVLKAAVVKVHQQRQQQAKWRRSLLLTLDRLPMIFWRETSRTRKQYLFTMSLKSLTRKANGQVLAIGRNGATRRGTGTLTKNFQQKREK